MSRRDVVFSLQSLLLGSLILSGSDLARAQTFNVVDLDPGDPSGLYTNIALDAADKAHVVFCEQGLTTENYLIKYATNSSGSWQLIYLPGSTSTDKKLYPSIAIGPDGNPKIVYYDGTVQHPMLVEKTGGGWTTPQVIDPTGNAGFYPTSRSTPSVMFTSPISWEPVGDRSGHFTTGTERRALRRGCFRRSTIAAPGGRSALSTLLRWAQTTYRG
jgi:hypothetical protein